MKKNGATKSAISRTFRKPDLFAALRAVCVILFLLGTAPAHAVVVVTNLFSFNGTNGNNPATRLLQTADGSFYGTTEYGGANSAGTIYKLSPGGSFTNVFSFNLTNGNDPSTALIIGQDGNLYGTTAYGGAYISSDTYGYGFGTLYQFNTNGTLNLLTSFDSTNGSSPMGVVQAANGDFFGMANSGGSHADLSGHTLGTLFQIDTNHALSMLLSFNGTNGANPTDQLVLGPDGYYYGTTTYGGTNQLGTVFRLNTNGSITVLNSFNDTNGSAPNTLIVGSDGNFYCSTMFGGSSDNGTIFKMTTNGALTTIATFDGTNTGGVPSAIFQATDGRFYGVTDQGGTSNYGTVFSVTTNGAITTLYTFTNGADGNSGASLMQGRDGNFYGTTYYGGGHGNIFKLSIVPTPNIQNLTLSNNAIHFTWPAATGQSYEVQYKTNLTQTNWSLLEILTTTNLVGGATDSVGPDPQRFYRVLVVQ